MVRSRAAQPNVPANLQRARACAPLTHAAAAALPRRRAASYRHTRALQPYSAPFYSLLSPLSVLPAARCVALCTRALRAARERRRCHLFRPLYLPNMRSPRVLPAGRCRACADAVTVRRSLVLVTTQNRRPCAPAPPILTSHTLRGAPLRRPWACLSYDPTLISTTTRTRTRSTRPGTLMCSRALDTPALEVERMR